MFDIWKQLTFGRYLQFLIDFVSRNSAILGLILFAYVIVIFIGKYGGLKYTRDRFDQFIIDKSRELLKKDKKIKPGELVDKVYQDWKNEISKFPSYIYIQSKRDYWIEKPTLQGIEERLKINRDRAIMILEKNGVIIGE